MLKSERTIKVKAPASTANLGSGFDSIGVAFQMYTEVEMSPHHHLQFEWSHESGEITPFPFPEEENLIYQAMKRVCQLLNKDIPKVRVSVKSNIPSTRGLGSSASALVAGLVAANRWFDDALSNDELLWLAAEKEGHTDNVGASLFGGVFIGAIDWEKQKVHYNSFPFPNQWTWLAAIPSYSLSTEGARNELPDQYQKEDVVFNLSRYGILVSSLQLGDEEGIKAGLSDRLHSPYRQHNIPGFERLVSAQDEINALGFIISGAGPTILGLFRQRENLEQARLNLINSLKTNQHEVQVIPLDVDQTGVQVSENSGPDYSMKVCYQSNEKIK